MIASEQEQFNIMWEQILEEHLDQIKNIENDLQSAHQEEIRRFDEETGQIVVPKPKFSKDYLNMQHTLEKLIKSKMYTEAQDISDKLELQVFFSKKGFNIVIFRRRKRPRNGISNMETNMLKRSNFY